MSVQASIDPERQALGLASATPLSCAPASAACSRNGLIRSSGSGKTIVEFWFAPISSSVWR